MQFSAEKCCLIIVMNVQKDRTADKAGLGFTASRRLAVKLDFDREDMGPVRREAEFKKERGEAENGSSPARSRSCSHFMAMIDQICPIQAIK